MKTQTGKNQRSKLVVSAIIAASVIVLGAGGYFVYVSGFSGNNSASQKTSQPQPVNKVDYSTPSTDQKSAGDTTKTQTVNPNANDTKPVSSNKVTITVLQQTDSTLQLRSYIDTVTSSGNCTLALTMDSFSVEKTAKIQPSADISSCQGFDVPLTELSKGTWKATLTYLIGTTATTATSTIAIK